MKKYSAYKDSGIEWIGEIPEHWKALRMQNIGMFSASGIDKKINPDEPLVSMVNYMDIYGNPSREISSERPLMQVSCATDKISSCSLNSGDLVFTPSSETKEDIGLSALITEDLQNTVFSYHTIRFRFETEFNHRYRKYLCNNYFVLNQFSRSSKGTTRQILVRDDFKNIKVLIPSLVEQQAIADFLDKKTVLIDGLIEKKKRQIELLKEQRQAVINQAVTKGLDPDVEMKDRGIEWLGKIPKHWEVKWLKHHFQFEKGKDAQLFTKEYIAEHQGEYPVYSGQTENEGVMGTINHYIYDTDVMIFVTTVGAKAMTTRLIKGKYSLSQNCALIRPKHKELDVRYQNYLLTQIFNYEKGRISLIMQPSLRFEDLVLYKILYPPFKEQIHIADYLEAKTLEYGSGISKAKQQIELLQEYRTALISEAVTGKIDVRKAV